MGTLQYFNPDELQVVNTSVELAEEVVSNHYKLSASQLSKLNYDIKTLKELSAEEIVDEHFAQIIRYSAKRKDKVLDTFVKDFYKICFQDHIIIPTLKTNPELDLLTFSLYIASHELIHIIRFRHFLQQFDAPVKERMAEEARVHAKTHEILSDVSIDGVEAVLKFYEDWRNLPHDVEKS